MSADAPMMACGHTANGYQGRPPDHVPCCVICSMVGDDRATLVVGGPDLTGRVARCGYGCGSEEASSLGLAFFEHCPEFGRDVYYCGCKGWD